MKLAKLLAVILCSMLFIETAFSKGVKKSSSVPSYGRDVAKSVSILLKRSKNLDSFLNTLKGQYTPKELRDAKKLLLKRGYSLKDKLPDSKLVGSKVVFDKSNYVDFINSSLLVANGLKIRKSNEKLDKKIENILNQLEKKKATSFLHDLFFPKAHAFDVFTGLVASVAGGAAGYWAGPALLGISGIVGVGLGVGAVYLFSEIMQTFKDGHVTCTDGGNYQLQEKGRNGLLMAKAKYSQVSQAVLAEADLPSKCTVNDAKRLKAFLKSGNRSVNSRDDNIRNTEDSASGGSIM